MYCDTNMNVQAWLAWVFCMLNFHTEKMPPEWIGATFDDISRFSTTTQMYLGVVDEYGRITLATNTTRKMSSADRVILASSVE